MISWHSDFSICDPLFENLCFVKVCYFVHYTWDCWCSFKFRWLHILLSYSTMFMFALFGNLAMPDCSLVHFVEPHSR